MAQAPSVLAAALDGEAAPTMVLDELIEVRSYEHDVIELNEHDQA